jgi:hypothetical protein
MTCCRKIGTKTDREIQVSSSASQVIEDPKIQVALYDPYLASLNVQDFYLSCGNPPLYYYEAPPVLTVAAEYAVWVNQYSIKDPVGAMLNTSGNNSRCSPQAQSMVDYLYYDSAFQSALPGDSINTTNSLCDVANATGQYLDYEDGGICTFSLHVHMVSSMITTFTSSHGINTLQILLDEGGILAAILFVTWFFGIFVIGARIEQEKKEEGEDQDRN